MSLVVFSHLFHEFIKNELRKQIRTNFSRTKGLRLSVDQIWLIDFQNVEKLASHWLQIVGVSKQDDCQSAKRAIVTCQDFLKSLVDFGQSD